MPVPDRRRRITAFVVAIAVLIATPLVVVASDAFTDVADSNVHHDDITWLAEAAVTLGCNPPTNDQFCPGDAVTRQQMASFLRRLAENQVVDAATAVTAEDADMLDGQPSAAYRSIVAADLNSDAIASGASEETELNSLTITAPVPGVIVVAGTAFTRNVSGSEALFGLRPSVNGTLLTGAAGNAIFGEVENNESLSLAYSVAFEVPAGTHTVAQTASVLNAGSGQPMAGNFFYNANNLTAVWHPEGTVTIATASGGSEGDFSG